MSVDLASTLKTFVGDKTLTTDLLLEAASHLVDSLKELSLTDMEKNQLVFTALLAHVTPKPACLPVNMTSCLPLRWRLPFFKNAPVAAAAPVAASSLTASPVAAPVTTPIPTVEAAAELAVRVPESS